MTAPQPSTLRDGIDPYEHLAPRPEDADRCPHCNGVGRVVPDEQLRFVCALCGGPRFGALAPGLVPPDAAARALRDAEKARRSRAAWRAASIFTGIGAAFMALITLLFALFTVKTALVTGLLFVLPLVVGSFLSSSRARSAGARIAPALDSAWGALAAAAVHARGAASPDQLARALGVGVSQAEALHDVVAVDAEIGATTEAARVRIGGGEHDAGPKSSLAPDPRFEALEARARAAESEAAASGEAEQEERKKLVTANTIIASPGDDGSPR